MYIKYKDLVTKRNLKKVYPNEMYFTERGIYTVSKDLKLIAYSDNDTNTTIINNIQDSNNGMDFMLMGA